MNAGRVKQGFTIVELLIVVVVIAILASIAIVSYNGIQVRSKNAAIVSAASQAYKSVQAYTSINGEYPALGTDICITSDSGCANASGQLTNLPSSFVSNLSAVSSLPKSVPIQGSVRYGVLYSQSSTRTFNGQASSAIIFYYLLGVNKQCGLPNIANDYDGNLASSTTGYTWGNLDGKTACIAVVLK